MTMATRTGSDTVNGDLENGVTDVESYIRTDPSIVNPTAGAYIGSGRSPSVAVSVEVVATATLESDALP